MVANASTTHWPCGHVRTLDNALGRKLHNGCAICGKRTRREAYYRSRGWHEPPMPLAYRNALKGGLRRYYAVDDGAGLKVVRARIIDILNAATPVERASYLMRDVRKRPVEEIAHWLASDTEVVTAAADAVKQRVEETELQDYYKDWPLVQRLIDEGVPESDVRQLICISEAGWNAAKRERRVRV